MATRNTFLFATALSAVLTATATGQQLKSTLVAAGFARPVAMTSPPGDTQRLFVVEQHSGMIKIIKNGVVLATPFLDVNGNTTGNEQGVLGLAFHPDYANNGFFYVSGTFTGGGAAGRSEVRRYTVSAGDPDVADVNFTLIFTENQPQSNHNGGGIAFGPDGKLWLGLGDGGSANDTGTGHVAGGNAQSLTTRLGKMIRMNDDGTDPGNNPWSADGDGVDDLIWSYGLRNPWRWSFDRLTGDLYIADVGQNAWEELNFTPSTSVGGENYGWRCMEGLACTGLTGCTCNAPSLQLPVHVYGHGGGNCSVTGGYAYRGAAIPSLQGTYFFADYCSSQIWSFQYNGSVQNLVNRTAELDPPGILAINNVTSFAEDVNGEVYILDQSGGEVYRIDQVCPTPTTYCVAALNSTGLGATMGWTGTGQIATNNLTFTTSGAPANVNGLYFFGDGQTQVPMANGFRCIASNLVRLPVVQTNFLGDAFFAFDFNQPYAASWVPGATKNVQFWYRDVAGGGALSNVSDGLSVIVCQ